MEGGDFRDIPIRHNGTNASKASAAGVIRLVLAGEEIPRASQAYLADVQRRVLERMETYPEALRVPVSMSSVRAAVYAERRHQKNPAAINGFTTAELGATVQYIREFSGDILRAQGALIAVAALVKAGGT